MTTWLPQCFKCVHFHKTGYNTCAAYPDEIPTDIWMNEVLHDKPIKGDHGIQFAPKT